MLNFDKAQIPVLLFIAAVLNALTSGNDKAPYLVIMVLFLSLLYSLGLFISTLVAKRGLKLAIKRAAIAGAPLLYTLAVLLLDDFGLVDAYYFIGFK